MPVFMDFVEDDQNVIGPELPFQHIQRVVPLLFQLSSREYLPR